MESPTFIFLPGLGADHRLFENQTAAFANAFAVDWIDPLPGETLERYAVRLAESLKESLKFATPPVVCGLSLGGMIAPYVAQRLGSSRCILLCTVRSPDQFPKRYYPFWLLGRICPWSHWLGQFFVQFTARMFLLFPQIWRQSVPPEVIRQLVETDTTRLARLIKMMLDWAYRSHKQGPEEFSLQILQIHGTRDPLLPISRTNPDICIPSGGHLLVLSHPEQINAAIQKFVGSK